MNESLSTATVDLPAWVPVKAYEAYAEYVGEALPDILEFEEAYEGAWSSREEYAQQLAKDLGVLNSTATWPSNYIDWPAATRDLFISDCWSVWIDGEEHVFRTL